MKNLCIFIITFVLVIAIGLIINQVFAITINDFVVPDIWKQYMTGNFCILEDVIGEYYIYVGIVTGSGSINKIYNTSGSVIYRYDSNGNYSKVGSTQGSYQNVKRIISVNYNILDKDNSQVILMQANYSLNQEIRHGDKYTFFNNKDSIMYQNVNLKLNKIGSGAIMLADENGNLLNQYSFTESSGTIITIELPPQQYVNAYFMFMPDDIPDTYFTLDILNYDYIDYEVYVPMYRITGGTTVKLNGFSIPNTTPFIISNYSTEIFYQWTENNITKKTRAVLTANQPFYFSQNVVYLIKFAHESTTTIRVQSNLALLDTEERIEPNLSDDELRDLIISNGGVIQETSNPSKYIEVNRTKVLKITSKRTGIFTNLMKVLVQGSSNSNSIISRYAFQSDMTHSLIKLGEYQQIGNEGQYKVTIPNDNGYVVVEENSGITLVEISGEYKENTDYIVELIDKANYVKDEAVEAAYRESNPNPTPIGKGDGYVNKVGDSVIGNIFDNWGQENGIENVDISGKLQGLLSPLGTFINFVTGIFVQAPEISALVTFGFMAGIVMFILGR